MFSDDDRPLVARSSIIGMSHANGSKMNGHVKEEGDSEMSESNDEPLVSHSPITLVQLNLNLIFRMLTSQASHKPGKISLKRKQALIAESSSSDDDIPLASSPAKPTKSKQQNGKGMPSKECEDKRPPKKKIKQALDMSVLTSGGEEDKYILSKKNPRKTGKITNNRLTGEELEDDKLISGKAATRGRGVIQDELSGSDIQKPKKRGRAKKEEDSATFPAKGRVKKEEEEEIVFKWWEQDPNDDGSSKWTTLEHFGVIFPPPYEPLPPGIKMKYNGQFSAPCHLHCV